MTDDMADKVATIAAKSPVQSFVLLPLITLLGELLVRRRIRLRGEWLLLCLAGYGLYRGAGRYRMAQGAGSEGFRRAPDKLVTTGPYAISRNPMYLGHLLYGAGVALATGSPIAVAGFLYQLRRFTRRVRIDEERIEQAFGDEYREYRKRVPRWVPYWD
ncbi:MAG: isoprenylcysteine carboxylmethyltransferase family protein [Chloroflexota bacterium]|nr:isoprenylcysteine carboxylmethyltransferase family protein [Chloroflexota bacterium]